MVCYVGLGSNLGDRLGYLKKAVGSLKETEGFEVLRISPVYETEPLDAPGPAQGDYLNCVVELKSSLEPRETLRQLKKIEARLGRAPSAERWQSREIDCDLLYYGDRVIHEEGLTVPHPGIAQRYFVLKPLSDLAPEWIDRQTGRDVRTMLGQLGGQARGRKCHETIVP